MCLGIGNRRGRGAAGGMHLTKTSHPAGLCSNRSHLGAVTCSRVSLSGTSRYPVLVDIYDIARRQPRCIPSRLLETCD